MTLSPKSYMFLNNTIPLLTPQVQASEIPLEHRPLIQNKDSHRTVKMKRMSPHITIVLQSCKNDHVILPQPEQFSPQWKVVQFGLEDKTLSSIIRWVFWYQFSELREIFNLVQIRYTIMHEGVNCLYALCMTFRCGQFSEGWSNWLTSRFHPL